jgi:hypothetical protein
LTRVLGRFDNVKKQRSVRAFLLEAREGGGLSPLA